MKKKLALSLVVGAVCLWLAVRNIRWADVLGALTEVELAPIPGILLMMFASHFFRARRWQVLIRPIRRTGLWEMFGMNAVGFLAIQALPFRLGEVSRPILLKRRHEISLSAGLAAVTVERVFDGLVAVAALAVGVLAAPIGFGDMPSIGMGLRSMMWLALAFYAPILGFLVLAVVKRDSALRILEGLIRFLPLHWRGKARSVAKNFFDGLRSLPDLKSFAQILAESIGVWGAIVVSYWLCLLAFNMDLPWAASFTILGVSAVGIMIPSPPGFVGTYQLFVVASLALYDVGKSEAFAYSIVAHALNLLYIVATGLAFSPQMAAPLGSLVSESIEAEEAASSP